MIPQTFPARFDGPRVLAGCLVALGLKEVGTRVEGPDLECFCGEQEGRPKVVSGVVGQGLHQAAVESRGLDRDDKTTGGNDRGRNQDRGLQTLHVRLRSVPAVERDK